MVPIQINYYNPLERRGKRTLVTLCLQINFMNELPETQFSISRVPKYHCAVTKNQKEHFLGEVGVLNSIRF